MSSGRKGNYAYTVARVKAKKSLLLGEEDYNKMLQMSVPEISRYISEAGYSKEMADLAGKLDGMDLLEYATYDNMAKVFSSILAASQGELHTMVAAYLEKWDIWNLKVILRGKSYGVSADKIREDLVLAGSLSGDDVDKLLSLDSDEEILAAFGRMMRVSVPQDVMSSYKESGNLGVIEDYLDKLHYTRLLASIKADSAATKLFESYVRNEIDVRNVASILKLKVEGVYGEEVMKYIIPGGKKVDKRMLTQLSNAETVQAAASDLQQLDFYDSFKGIVEEEGVSLNEVVTGMWRYDIDQSKKFSHLYPLSVIPVVDFMIHKEMEVRNIRTIARGVESGLDKDIIKGLLVI